jgi:hypothetical protein
MAMAASQRFISSGGSLSGDGVASPIRLKESWRVIAQSSLPLLS